MTKEELCEIIKRENVSFIRLQFSDIDGTVKNVEIPAKEIGEVVDNGMLFDGSSVEGFVRIEESDMYLVPDIDTFAILPWTRDGVKSARIICDVYTPNGTPFEGDPRYRLKLVAQKAREMGFVAYAGPEMEFFMVPVKDGQPVFEFLDSGSYFDLLPLSVAERVRRDVAVALNEMGIFIEASHHEVAPSQHEIDFRYDEIVTTADNAQTVKLVVKTMAIFHGLYATFMPKPFFGVNGSGMHTHISLFKDGENAFYDPGDELKLSKTLKYFVGGLLEHAREITAVTNPTVNSYKRLVPGYEAPINVAWSVGNRSALIRVPKARGKATRIEYRAPDPSTNVYLAFAVMLAAGLDGIEREIEPPLPIEENIYSMSSEKRREHGIESLPGDLKEALDLMKESKLVKKVLGDHIFEKFVEAKEREWREYSTKVSDWERQTYFWV